MAEGIDPSAFRRLDWARDEYVRVDKTQEDGYQTALFRLENWLWRVTAMEEALRDADSDRYLERRDAADLTGVFYGLKYVCERYKHQFEGLASLGATRARNGLTFPMEFPLVWQDLVWLPADELPTPDPGRKGRAERDGYERYLAGKNVTPLVIRVSDFLLQFEPEAPAPCP